MFSLIDASFNRNAHIEENKKLVNTVVNGIDRNNTANPAAEDKNGSGLILAMIEKV